MCRLLHISVAYVTNRLAEQNDLVSLHYSDFRLYDNVRVSILYQSLHLRAIRHVRGVIELNCGALRICYYYNNIHLSLILNRHSERNSCIVISNMYYIK